MAEAWFGVPVAAAAVAAELLLLQALLPLLLEIQPLLRLLYLELLLLELLLGGGEPLLLQRLDLHQLDGHCPCGGTCPARQQCRKNDSKHSRREDPLRDLRRLREFAHFTQSSANPMGVSD